MKALWAAVAAFDDALQRDFLMFVTGSKTAPMGGFGALRPPAHASFKVQRAGPDSDALPTSHTCFNTLLLPEYDPPQKVAKLLERTPERATRGSRSNNVISILSLAFCSDTHIWICARRRAA